MVPMLAFDWSELIQQTIAGLANGGIYATLALALVLIHRATGVINFAQGEMAMFSAYMAWALVTHHGFGFWLALAASMVVSFFGGAGIYMTVIRPLSRAGDIAIVIATIAVLVIVNGVAGWIWTPVPQILQSPFPIEPITIGTVVISPQYIGIIAVSVVCVFLVFCFFRFTRTGLLMRASAVRPATSRLLGIRVTMMLAIGWGLAASLGAVAGTMSATITGLDPNFMQTILVYAFAAAVLGGLDSPGGAVAGAYILGVGISLLSTYVNFVTESPELELPIALGVLLAVLLIKPAGIFGRTVTRRV